MLWIIISYVILVYLVSYFLGKFSGSGIQWQSSKGTKASINHSTYLYKQTWLHMIEHCTWNHLNSEIRVQHEALSFDWANIVKTIIYTIIQFRFRSIPNQFLHLSVLNVVWPPSPRLFPVKSHLSDVVLHPPKAPNRSLRIIRSHVGPHKIPRVQFNVAGKLDDWISPWASWNLIKFQEGGCHPLWSCLPCGVTQKCFRRQVLNGETTNQIHPLDNIPKDPDWKIFQPLPRAIELHSYKDNYSTKATSN